MSKVWTCDVCELKDSSENIQRPDGWGKLKIDHRLPSNIGGAIANFDLCPQCSRIQFSGFREKLIELIKSLKGNA